MRSLTLALLLVSTVATGASAQLEARGEGAGGLGSPFGGRGFDTPSDAVQADAAAVLAADPGSTSAAPPPSYDDVPVPTPPGPVPPPAFGASDVRIPSSIATRVRALDADLQILAARGGGNIVDGVLSILTGGVSITLGILLNGAPSNYLYVYGGVGVVRGVLSLALMTNPSAAATEYTHMPMGTAREVRARLRYGEAQLDAIADMARIGRILDGSLNIAAGLAIVPIYLGPNNFAFTSPFDYFVLIGAAISTVSGVITLFSSNEAERRQSAYHELRDRLEATPEGAADEEALEALDAPNASIDLTPSLAVMPGGAYAGLTGTF